MGYFYDDIFIVNLSAFIIVFSIFVFFLNFPFERFFWEIGSYTYAFFSGALIIYLFPKT